jgi:hypothetical protein
MGKAPRVLAPTQHCVSVVACHPRRDAAAVGYEDGLVLLVRMADAVEVVARRPGGTPVSALAWQPAGTALAFAAEDGAAGIIKLT